MKNVKNTIKASAGLGLLAISNVALATNTTSTNVNTNKFMTQSWQASNLQTTQNTLDVVLVKWIWYITWFLGLIAIIIGLWWAFNILTAAWDEEKVKKGKDIIIRVIFWLVAIFSINIIMRFVINALFSQS